MYSDLQISNQSDESITKENMQNASAFLSLLHGKSDSICRLFNKEIIVDKSQLQCLNVMMLEKLSLHNIVAVTTSVDIVLANKKVLSFKSWQDFFMYDFLSVNSSTKLILLQWDFFADLNYKVPQRHTVNIRISSTPKPSDIFKILLNGGFDETNDVDIQSCTMICKVDFVNNTLAEELVNVAENWNDLCECAVSQKGSIRPLFYKHRRIFANISEFSTITAFCIFIAVVAKILITDDFITINSEFLLYSLIASSPILLLVRNIGRSSGKKTFEKLGEIMVIHIFKISKGDEKESQRIEKASSYKKEFFWFAVNAIFSIGLSISFFMIG